MDGSPRYLLKSKLHEGHNSVIFRGARADDDLPVVIKVLKEQYPDPRSVAQLRREYATLRELDLGGVVKVYALETYGNGLALVMEDSGGVPLSEVIHGEPLPLRRALVLAHALARTLAQLHERSIVHKDIKPHNILVNPADDAVKLIDFGIAMKLVRDAPRAASPEVLEGTLLYMSPEQSGRMNRAVDQRTDLYSLGVTIYEMLVGGVPFVSTDAMELVHSHIARTPTAPRQRLASIPQVVSDIVMRLLAKGPEDRYQHAHGLAADLARCLAEYDATGDVAPFELGARDVSDALRLSQGLYGRDDEVRVLHDALARVRSAKPELLLVTGGPGVGKTTLVHEMHRAVARGGGRFVSGSFDLQQRGAPFGAVAGAFADLVRQLLAESPAALAEWRGKLQAALGGQAAVLVDLVPGIERIVGPQPAPPVLRPTESQNRFRMALQGFVRVFCSPSAPLVVFIDDLHGADVATLGLLRTLLADPTGTNLLVIGAYRDGELSADHPLRSLAAQVRKDGGAVRELPLAPLDRAGVRALLADVVGEHPGDPPERLDALTARVFDKTHGNPFFIAQFLVALHQRGALFLDREAAAWRWDIAAVAAAPITDNVVDFMAERMRSLGPDTQRLLAVAACIGHRFELGMLAHAVDRSVGRVLEDLWPALNTGLLEPVADSRLLAEGEDEDLVPALIESPDLVIEFRFLHDRVQRAALALMSAAEREETHLRIGRHLRARLGDDPRGDALFAAVRQLNACVTRLRDPEERLGLARADLAAARHAKRSTDYAEAAALASAGVAALPQGAWEAHYDLAFALHREQAESEYMSGRADHADALFADLLVRSRTDAERAELISLRMILLSTQGRFAEGMVAARAGLRLFGVELPEDPMASMAAFMVVAQEIDAHMAGTSIESLIDRPAMESPTDRAVLRLLNETFAVAFVVDATLGLVAILKHVLLSLTRGHAELTAFGYATYGYILAGPLGRPHDGLRFGHLALRLLERFPTSEVACRVHFMLGFHAGHTQPLRTAIAHHAQALQVGLEYGDFLYASQGAVFRALTRLKMGDELGSLASELAEDLALMAHTRDAMSQAQVILLQQVVEALQHRRWFDAPLGDPSAAEDAWLAGVDAAGLIIVRCLHNILKMMVLSTFDAHPEAAALIPAIKPMMPIVVGATYTNDFSFHAALTLIAVHEDQDSSLQAATLAEIEVHRAAVAAWAGHCPANEQHRLHIVDAEIARLRGQDLDAMDEYDRAIDWARKNGYAQHEALANELCGNFHLGRGRGQVARVYFSQARFGYERWGALAKVRDLDRIHPHLATRSEGAAPPTSTTRSVITSSLSTTGNQGLDLASVIKASQAVTVEIALQPLLEKVIAIMAENAGARRGVLLLDRDGQLEVVAQSTADAGPRTLAVPIPLDTAEDVPRSILHYIANTCESIILEDAVRLGPFTADPYIAAREIRSVLCTPLVHQAKLLGVLYLEHDLTPGVFSEGRLHTLKLIGSQAAISIENANLYANMERLVRKRTDELHRANDSLTASNAELDAFGRTVAHDLKNPLSAMAGYSEYLIENLVELEQGEVVSIVENIRRAVQTAANIVDELLLLAGVRKQQVQATRLDMQSIVRQTVQRMTYMVREYRGELTVTESWPSAAGYAPWVEEAWVNYISNGLKYGGSPPRLTLGADAQDDGTVRFWVRDNGPGIPEDAQGRLFAEFTRLGDARTEGHGLGLSIVRRIIERLGGHVGAESSAGQGSMFWFSLPAAP